MRVYLNKYLRNDFIRSLISFISIIENEQRDLLVQTSKDDFTKIFHHRLIIIVRRKRQFYRMIVRRRFRIYFEHMNVVYSRFRTKQIWHLYEFYELSDHHRSTKTRKLNCTNHMIARATSLATTSSHMIETCDMQQILHKSKVKTSNDVETNCWVYRSILCLADLLQNRMCRRKSRRSFVIFSKQQNAAKWIAMSNELHQEMCSKFSKLYKLQAREISIDQNSLISC